MSSRDCVVGCEYGCVYACSPGGTQKKLNSKQEKPSHLPPLVGLVGRIHRWVRRLHHRLAALGGRPKPVVLSHGTTVRPCVLALAEGPVPAE